MTGATPGPWRVKGNAVIADAPAPGIGGSDDITYYGGHLIAESINPPNAILIAATPEMRALLAWIVAHCEVPLADDPERLAEAVELLTRTGGVP
jgi:hypothetical protein